MYLVPAAEDRLQASPSPWLAIHADRVHWMRVRIRILAGISLSKRAALLSSRYGTQLLVQVAYVEVVRSARLWCETKLHQHHFRDWRT